MNCSLLTVHPTLYVILVLTSCFASLQRLVLSSQPNINSDIVPDSTRIRSAASPVSQPIHFQTLILAKYRIQSNAVAGWFATPGSPTSLLQVIG